MIRLNQTTIGKLSVGHIVNLASNDVQRFDLVRNCYPFPVVILYIVLLAGLNVHALLMDRSYLPHCLHISGV